MAAISKSKKIGNTQKLVIGKIFVLYFDQNLGAVKVVIMPGLVCRVLA